ncbi:transposon-like protein [Tanacetum coccineum]
MRGRKSHDCHVFMERLLPIALREMFLEPIWKAMTEVSLYFRELCLSKLKVEQLEKMERDIVVTMCKLEKILPPGFFDHMEHLLVHLSYKAKVGGPVQYRWMYPFERYSYHLKKKVKNKARVKSSISDAYIMEEILNFYTHYFKSHVQTNLRKVGRNDDKGSVNLKGTSLSVFNYRGRPSGTCKRCYLDDDEYDVATFYVLHNCEEIQPFLAEMKVERPNITTVELIDMTQQRFGHWFRDYVLDSSNSHMFHTKHHSLGRKTLNTDICLVGEEGDYYSQLTDVIKIPARSTVIAPTQPIESAYQEDGTSLPFIITENNEIEQLHDVEGDVEEVELQHLGFVYFSEVLPLHLQTMSAEEEMSAYVGTGSSTVTVRSYRELPLQPTTLAWRQVPPDDKTGVIARIGIAFWNDPKNRARAAQNKQNRAKSKRSGEHRFLKLFRNDDKFSQMLSQLESQPEIGGGSGSGGCGDDDRR